MNKILVLSFSLCIGTLSVMGQGTAIEPTPLETEMLELINRLRMSPKKEGDLMVKSGIAPGHVDLSMFKKEMDALSPAQPLVFNLKLLQAARNHTGYQLHNGQGHKETPGKEGFTGEGIMDRYRHTGYSGGGGENVFIYAKNPWHGQVAFVIDWKMEASDGGMQDGRGHRRNLMNDGYGEVGVGMASSTNSAVTQNFGRGSRSVGGVAYSDKNKNGRYDAGEGIAGVEISVGGQKITTWKSGAYVLPIGKKSGKISAKWGSRYLSSLVPAGSKNFKFDFLPEKAQGAKMTFVQIYKIDKTAKEEGFDKFFKSRIADIMKDGDELNDAVAFFKQTALKTGADQAPARELYEKLLDKVSKDLDYLGKLIKIKPSESYGRLLEIQKNFGSDPALKMKIAKIAQENNSSNTKILVKLNLAAEKVLNDTTAKDFVKKSQLKRVLKNYQAFLKKSIDAELRFEAEQRLLAFLESGK